MQTKKLNKLNKLIESSNLNQLQKNVTLGFISRAINYEVKISLDKQLVTDIVNEKRIKDIIISTDDCIIYSVIPKEKDDWETKFPYRSIFKKENKWIRCTTVSPTLDIAYLVYLENKYLNNNCNFTDFALKMLEIKYED